MKTPYLKNDEAERKGNKRNDRLLCESSTLISMKFFLSLMDSRAMNMKTVSSHFSLQCVMVNGYTVILDSLVKP